jgi:hypothetical protein
VRDLLTGWRDRTWPHRLLPGHRWQEPADVVAVAGVSERAGATTLAVLLAAVYAGPGRGRVLVTDAASGLGRLGEVLAGRSDGQVSLPGADSWAVLAPHLERTAEGCWTVIADGAGPADAEAEPLACQLALAALSPHFAVVVLDCGWLAVPRSRFFLGLADSRVLATPATVEGVLAAAAALDRLPALVGLVGTPDPRAVDLASASRLLTGRGGTLHELPHDPVLAAGGDAVPDALSPDLREATLALATALLRTRHRPHTVPEEP